MCGGGASVPQPPVDPAQSALEQEQLNLLQSQAQQQKAFAPLQAEQYGYVQVEDPAAGQLRHRLTELKTAPQEAGKYGKDDNIASITSQLAALPVSYVKTDARSKQDALVADLQTQQLETSKKANDALNKYLDSLDTDDYKAYQKAQQDLQAQQTQIAIQQGERTQKALKGELPLSQGTIDRKAADFRLLKENLARGGNALIGDDPSSAYSLTSPGSQALKEFNSRYASVEDQERRGALDSGTQAYLSAVGLSGNLGKSDLGTVGQLSNPGGYAGTSTSINPNSTPVTNNMSLVQGYSSAIQPYLQAQQLATQINSQNAQLSANQNAGWLQLGGTVAGAAIAAKSNRRFKKNIEPIKSDRDATKALAKTPVYRWNYKDEKDGHKKHLGTMTDEAPDDVVTDDGDYLDITSYLGLLTLSTRDLDSRILSLEGRRV